MAPSAPRVSLLEYARFQSSRLKLDLGRSSRGFFALGSGGTEGSSSSSSTSALGLGFFSALGAAGLGSFFSLAGGTYCLALSQYVVSPKISLSLGLLTIVSMWRTILLYFLRSSGSKVQATAFCIVVAMVRSATVMRSWTRNVREARWSLRTAMARICFSSKWVCNCCYWVKKVKQSDESKTHWLVIRNWARKKHVDDHLARRDFCVGEMDPLVNESALFRVTTEQARIGSQTSDYKPHSISTYSPKCHSPRTVVRDRWTLEQIEAILGLKRWDLPKRKFGQEFRFFVIFIMAIFSREINGDPAKGSSRQDLRQVKLSHQITTIAPAKSIFTTLPCLWGGIVQRVPIDAIWREG